MKSHLDSCRIIGPPKHCKVFRRPCKNSNSMRQHLHKYHGYLFPEMGKPTGNKVARGQTQSPTICSKGTQGITSCVTECPPSPPPTPMRSDITSSHQGSKSHRSFTNNPMAAYKEKIRMSFSINDSNKSRVADYRANNLKSNTPSTR